MKKKLTWKDICILQGIVMIFSLTSVTAKFASGQAAFTRGFFLFYGLEVVILGVYALLWQQAIKRIDISIAYANKAMVLLWGLLWSVMIFHDSVTPKKIAGVLFVIAGVCVLNRDGRSGENAEDSAVRASAGRSEGISQTAGTDAGQRKTERKEGGES